MRVTAAALATAGAAVEEVRLPSLASYDDDWTVLWAVYMAAFYGHHLEELGDRMDRSVVKLIEHGRRVDAVDYKRLEIARTQLSHVVAGVMADFDGLLCPTMAVPAPPTGKHGTRPPPPDDGLYHAADMTALFNLIAPCPVVSVPAGFTTGGLPVGMQIVGRRWRDDHVLDRGTCRRTSTSLGRSPPVDRCVSRGRTDYYRRGVDTPTSTRPSAASVGATASAVTGGR